MAAKGAETKIGEVRSAAYRIPTDTPEADGTFAWDSTTLVMVFVAAAGRTGLGYTYADGCIVALIAGALARAIEGREANDVNGAWEAMQRAVRNLGRSGLAACAISAVDAALWDLKAKLHEAPLASLLGRRRDAVAVYGSGGFTNYSDEQLRQQLSAWVEKEGCRYVKMKIGADPARDPRRVAVARAAIGERQLFVDANGAFSVRQALDMAAQCRQFDIRWFEEPVTSDDPAGLRLVRERIDAAVDVAAGEYIFVLDDARRLLEAGSVDVLQADVTRCGGITGFLEVAALCEAHHVDLSGHCAPALHRHVACAAHRLRHLEWFHDHVRIEQLLFDGAPVATDGVIRTDPCRPGHGLDFKVQDAEPYRITVEL
jgi:L-alanine-DL-glutamate epimerase-like enolase superfamily enzyme